MINIRGNFRESERYRIKIDRVRQADAYLQPLKEGMNTCKREIQTDRKKIETDG